MKRIIFYIILIFLSYCKAPDEYINEDCFGNKELTQTKKLKIGEKIPSFTACTSDGSYFSLGRSKKNGIFVFFKTKAKPEGIVINDEVLNEKLKKIAKSNNIDLLVGRDLKIAKMYGVDIKGSRIQKSILIVINKEKVITKIYENICEDEIIEILNKLKTSPTKN